VEVRQLALALSMKWSLARGVRTALAELEGRVSARTRELEEAAARLEREIADKNDFLRNVTHDLSAPLRNIVGMLDAVAPACADRMPPEARDRLARARRSAQAELALIGEMLDFARLRARPQSAAIEDVGRIVKDVADSLTADLEAKGIRLEVAPAWPAIRCERPRVAQAFQNYIDNAIKYMGATPGARIAVAWHEDASRYVFRVEDNGTGIPADQLGRLFQIFTRGMNAASCAEGRGIGLAAVRAIAEAYGGTAWASSEVGRGSTFYFSLSKSHVAAPPSGT
jgi:signal transduction histidine kinase